MLPHKMIATAASLGLMVLPFFVVAHNQNFAQAHARSAGQRMQLFQAKSQDAGDSPVRVGDIIDVKQIDIVEQPEIYGLGNTPIGHRYAIVDNQLIRVSPKTGKVLSILRQIN